jgi:hypothetical protein
MSLKPKNSYIINLFGNAIQIWDLTLPQETLLKLATHQTKFNLTWEEVIFNLEIVEKLGYQNWTDFAKPITPIQLLMDDTARIELRKKSRLIELISAKELCSPSSLFSRYEVSDDEVSFEEPKQLRFIIRYKGLVSKFAFDDDAFRMDKLEFKLDRQNLQNEILLSAILLNGLPLSSLQDDLLHVRGEMLKEKK